MSDRVAAQTQQTADVGRRLEMHAHEMTSRMTFASAKKGALRSVQRAAAKAPRSWRSSTVMVFLSPCTLRRVRRRWKVERFFAWLHHSRRTVTRWEYHVDNFLGMIQLACARMLLRAFMR
jgi:hypothetical protein